MQPLAIFAILSLLYSSASAYQVSFYEATGGCYGTDNSLMRTIHGFAENDCFTFGNEWYNTECYQYQFEPGRLSPAGLGDCVGPFKATAATFYDSENVGVQCSFFKGLNCKEGKVEGLYGCPAKFWGESNEQIHSWRCWKP